MKTPMTAHERMIQNAQAAGADITACWHKPARLMGCDVGDVINTFHEHVAQIRYQIGDLQSGVLDTPTQDNVDAYRETGGNTVVSLMQELEHYVVDNEKLLDALECCQRDQVEDLIHESYFTTYIKDLIDACYVLGTEDTWPLCCMRMDYEAAAEEALIDYSEYEILGQTYYGR